jgi:long-chain acyl-CoA synthetase
VLRSDPVEAPEPALVCQGRQDFHTLPDDRGLYHVVAEGVRLRSHHPALSRRTEHGWTDLTFAEFGRDVRALALTLLGWGVRHGDRMAILGRNSYEWAVADFAALSIGAITVPVYPTASEDQVRHVLTDSGATYGFAELPEQQAMLTRLGAARWLAPVQLLADVPALAVDNPKLTPAFVERSTSVVAEDVATIVYTSGTTGLPKGCVLTHRNMFASSANTVRHLESLFLPDSASTLLCLPLSHVFGRSMLLACLFAGTRAGLLVGIPDLFAALPEFRPTFLALVPYALEKIRKLSRGAVNARAEQVAVEYGRALAVQDEVEPALAAEHRSLDRTVFTQVRDSFGGRFGHVICGGASLDTSTQAFFAGLGVQILGAYGLTEAATAVTINEVHANRAGSVGRPIPGTTVAIAADEEVLVGGLNASPGYWPLPEGATPGWLHTGDLGRLDEDGYLHITGRRKEILVTSGGKNVSPTPLEDRVRLHPLVSNCMVVGEARSFVTALVTLDAPALAKWAAQQGIKLAPRSMAEVPELVTEVQLAIDDANALVSRAESIRAFRLLDGDFTVDNGQLTPSMKLRRAVIEGAYPAALTALYG